MESVSGRFAIGVLSKSTGCNIETIRYYERAGLLPTPGRSPPAATVSTGQTI